MIMPVLAVKDVTASIDHYVNVLGFTESFRLPGPDGSPVFAFVALGEGNNVGLGLDPELSSRGNGVVLMIYPPDSTDIDQMYAEVKANGAKVTEDIKDQYWGDRSFTVTDPDGYCLQFAKTVKQIPMDQIEEAMKNR